MKSIQKEIKLYKDDINFLCKIDAKVYFDENNELDEGNIYFIHPLTGSEYENINSIFMNWKETKEKYNNYWDILKEKVIEDKYLRSKIFDLNEVAYYI